MFVIPSVDIKEGRVVRIFQGDPTKVILSENDPLEVSKRWLELGAKFIHIVDLDAVFGKEPQSQIISNILNLGVKATVGGGIRSFKTAEYYIKNGAWAVVVSTMIFENTRDFEKLLDKYPEKIIVALDFDENFKTATRGWKTLQKEIFEITELFDKNFKGYLFTSIFRDGTGLGISKEHFKKIADFDFGKDKIKIASGGISSESDIMFLRFLGFWGAVVGRAFYEGKINIFEI
ncbi:MAG: 1-(5-phosphoribosyl)-5-[(5-phosphoribosylamino)methylideneamino] imidazole-4-carboxamide isomerase [Candidatus Calescibacterium sp.]|nr:1-(5-phosphoribosyl)-5-[(5-phosphoribosylamino)methylideneamino] imidazole-4-carboxamide isomerase [Candidatus Calescibacterium sp.]MCX7733169.1 1-(5-phosphoribosyl)-5-[(5-phosphoribosylamino)methylideneamino] imidazole-4-carboxamide isomerase [bacterium]MDW8087824.1 1-(5-phosphoribosyl)-5-[(5-phosphoribosylamino)methylideneamino] imidazole-4-carboxamide isomerase [Candidatus Calescibacterium sp.]